jgi:hypothetical protein|tara:strand:- start:273 stop:1934 length:1662 start_codon:yes stop_codon:yes gene_type:complete
VDNPLNRRMFRQGGMSKQPMGILASSPELMGAVKGYNVGGLNAIPIFGTKRIPRSVQPSAMNTLGTPFQDIDVKIQDEIPLAVQEKQKEEIEKTIEPNVETVSSINEKNKKLLKNENINFPEGKNLGAKIQKDDESFEKKETKETPKSDVSVEELYGGDIKGGIEEQSKMIGVAYDRLNNNLATLKEKEFLGTTYNKESAKLMKLLREEGKEFTIADAKKVAKQMGFADPDDLDDQFAEDKEAAFWLNMMKAGAAMAAGESSNTLTNFAKGFTVGLDGYGKDISDLREDLREDKKEATKTIYNLLKDGKSEAIAKKALEIQKASAITDILKTEVGEEQTRLIREVENEVANRKLTISLFKTFADMNFEALKFNISRDDFNKSIEMAYAKMMPDDLKILQAAGQITVIDPSKPLTPDNIKASPDGVKNIENILTKNLSGKITDKRFLQGTAGKKGQTSSGIILNWDGREDYDERDAGDAIVSYNERRADTIKAAGGVETPYIASQDIQFAKVNNGKIDFSKQTNRMQKIFKDQSKGQSLLDLNPEVFINYKKEE